MTPAEVRADQRHLETIRRRQKGKSSAATSEEPHEANLIARRFMLTAFKKKRLRRRQQIDNSPSEQSKREGELAGVIDEGSDLAETARTLQITSGNSDADWNGPKIPGSANSIQPKSALKTGSHDDKLRLWVGTIGEESARPAATKSFKTIQEAPRSIN
ncbi:unnamed protein product [Linum trigynum]|uniref:Uncharacterized protein n=1 Tax=Linum trigynum TaxID=586398 RepID=A0AAV2GLA7_9ROSI